MSANAAAVGVVLFITGVLVDYWHVGRRSWGDACALVLVTFGAWSLWAHTSVATTTGKHLIDSSRWLLDTVGLRPTTADAVGLATSGMSLLAVYAVLAIVPSGAFTNIPMVGMALSAAASRCTLVGRESSRINWKIYAIGLPLGVLAPVADVPGTAVLVFTAVLAIGPQFLSDLGGAR